MNCTVIRSDNAGRRSAVIARISLDQLAEILDITEDGVVTADVRHEIVLFNRGAAKLFGYEPEEVLGRPLELLLPERFRHPHPGQVEEFARAPAPARLMGERREVFGKRRDGSEFPAEISISKFGTGPEMLFTAIVRDVTERKRFEAAQRELEHLRSQAELAEARARADERLRETASQREQALTELQTRTEELRATTQQLWQAAKLAGVGELAASIAHELNNPLGTVSLRIEGLIAKTLPEDPRRKPLEIVGGEVERMAGLVANLLQFSRAGREQVSTVDVCEEVTKTVELIGHHLRKHGVRVLPEFDRKVTTIHADRQHLRQVFLNLFTNAVDAMPGGGTLVPRVRPGHLPGGAPAVVIEVTDSGVGIPAELQDRVFEPFFTTKEDGKGTGLGLAICRRIVHQHNGTLEVESRVNAGTTIRVTLPVRPDTNVARLRD
ncbi:PAS domain S-box protein [Gemmata sp. G18]|uniref:histidine kinase n=1 Tax=Gemmata palustris TaxID=2822762 RepID=A0ABS5BN78_9BACT|nr:ATP-binding protein [Gemmata palustris]MBP3955171.1 PAS domain S-box protein [Gemmata palustris]